MLFLYIINIVDKVSYHDAMELIYTMKKRCQIPGNSVLKQIQRYFRMLCASSDEYFFVTDVAENIIMVSPNMVTDFGMPAEIFKDMDSEWLPRVHPDDYDEYVRNLHRKFTPEDNEHDAFYRVRDEKNSYVWVRCRGRMSFNPKTKQPELFAGIIILMEQSNQADVNTGLLAKYQFENAVKKMLARVDGEFPRGAIMIFGIDNFKIINESYNRRFGNILLRIAAETISTVLPPGMMLYKMDGDEFSVIVPDMDEKAAHDLFEAVQRAFCRPHLVEGRSLFCTISAGTVFYPQGGKDYLVLHKHAEAALDQAKREGKNKNIIFTKEHYNRWLRSISLQTMLQKSIDNDFEGFSLFYQPQVNARTQRLIGAEALLRWRKPTGRMVSPMEFVRILEDTKMIILVGKWVFETAVRQCKQWQEKWPGMRISINLSYEQLKGSGFEDFALDCLKRYDLPPYLVVLELTETAIVADWNNVNTKFRQFREKGISIAMDDFGTGYSSLSCLKNLACDIVKIDRAFVINITKENNDFDRQLVKSTIELCHSVGIDCCIEGVEEEKEYRLLRDFCHADSIQGYFFGRPEAPENFEKKFFVSRENPYLGDLQKRDSKGEP